MWLYSPEILLKTFGHCVNKTLCLIKTPQKKVGAHKLLLHIEFLFILTITILGTFVQLCF